MEVTNFSDVEEKINKKILEIRKIFPNNSDYCFSIDNLIARSLNLEVRELQNISIDGYILDKTIILNSDVKCEERKNFTLFHEITHYLIKTDDEINNFLMDYHAGQEEGYKEYIERLCNMGAGEFLAPMNEIRGIIDKKEFSINLIRDLDVLFPASKTALIFQLARAASHKCTLLEIARGYLQKKNDIEFESVRSLPRSEMDYYILYSATSTNNRYRPGRFTKIPKNHILRNAFIEESFIKSEDFIPYKNGNTSHRCNCEALFFQGKVYGLFNLEQPINNLLQPSLF